MKWITINSNYHEAERCRVSSLMIRLWSDRSAWIRDGPVVANRAHVGDDLPVVRPSHLDSVVCADSGATRVTWGTKPVVLRCTSRTSSIAIVGSSIHRMTEHVVREDWIVRDQGCSQMMGNALADVKHGINLSVCIFWDDLERSKELSG